MTERELQTAVIEMAQLLKWRCAHFRPAMSRNGKWSTPVQADGAGFPDLLMCRDTRCLAIELKVAGRKPGPEQVAWLEAFERAGFEADVWDTDDWARGHVEARLR